MGISNAHIPGPGDNSNIFERLSSYIIKVDPEWISRIKPASQESIALLRKLSGLESAGLDFPESYRIILNYMGKEDGGALRALNGDMCIEEIIECYKEIDEDESETLNPQYPIIITTDVEGEISLDMSQPTNPNVVLTYNGKFQYFYSENFEKLLFQYAFLKYESLYHPESIGFGGSQYMLKEAMRRHQITDVFDVVDSYAKDNGFQKAWFSDQRHYIGIREDATFFVRRGSAVSGIFTGQNKKFLKELGKQFLSKIGAEI